MFRSLRDTCLVAAISLVASVIWLDLSLAAQAPQLELLGEIETGLRVPTRIDVDSYGHIYVADSRSQQVVKFDEYGELQLVFNQEPVSGSGLAVTPGGDRIYASAKDKVLVFAEDGALLGYLGRGAGEFDAAGSITLDAEGHIYVADLGAGVVKVFSPHGSAAGQLGSAAFVVNSDIVVHPADQQIYLNDSFVSSKVGAAANVSIYSLGGALQQILAADSAFGSEPFFFFGGMTFDDQGRFYVGDAEGKTLRVLAADGTWLQTFDRNGELSRPGSMAFDSVTQRLFVIQGDRQVDIYGVDGAQNPVAVNNPPTVPVPVSPVGGSEVASQHPTLKFNNSSDEDEDELTYNLQVFDAAQNLVANLAVSESPAVSSAFVAAELVENGLYHWQVQSFDGEDVSDWSQLQAFYVNATQEAPSVPVLTAPLAGDGARTDALLKWQSAVDADPADTVTYLLEVATDLEFSELVYSEELLATERTMSDWSQLIMPGQEYFWRISAVDNHGLTSVSLDDGRFVYQASMLMIAANMPDAKAYLGGNHGYSGQLLGTLPLSVRDLPEGSYQLVVERAGFEPYIQPVTVQLETPTDLYVELAPALAVSKLAYKPLKVAGKPVSGSLVSPFVADLDLDGIEDLLIAHADGSLHYHPGQLAKQGKRKSKRRVRFTEEVLLSLPQMAGGTPFLVDWNNDYQQDLLIGTTDGAVWLFTNAGDFNFTGEPVLVATVARAAVPAVADIDSDGDKDLVVGSGDGELVLFSNLGTDAEPQLAEPQLLVAFADAVAPTFADWNGDGQRELLVATEGQLYSAAYTDGALAEMSRIKSKKDVARLVAVDLDGEKGKDLLLATDDGKLFLAGAVDSKSEYVAAFYQAVTEKFEQLQDVLLEEGFDKPIVGKLLTQFEKKKMKNVGKGLRKLVRSLPKKSSSRKNASELAAILLYLSN